MLLDSSRETTAMSSSPITPSIARLGDRWKHKMILETSLRTLWSQMEKSISGPWFNIKILSYQYRKSHCGNKTVVRPSYPHNGISYTGKMTSFYWISLLVKTLWAFHDICFLYEHDKISQLQYHLERQSTLTEVRKLSFSDIYSS